ncbi:MAG: threonine synthase [Armatimonadota bacterium]|nr:threonine synthase [Armatimonadota bacterium]MDR7451184.1 threonine synthase [Armatimonadota bacterium]MDR7467211.1 threonine synthase [Armatimonadota bacterium]MDR7494861.1 threonine synthase [Armatimonadota bacterium]MDR7500065.1 threonine synthase [Armatimonadota bacterium]
MAAQRLRCRECGATYRADPLYVCERCFGPLEVVYDYDRLAGQPLRRRFESGPPSIWRYEPLLPVDRVPEIDLQPGWSPLLHAPRLGRELGLRQLYIKNDGVNPTWSFKDRVVGVAVAAARHFGFEVVACASTGNLAHAVAAHSARAGLRACVFIPRGLERGKVVASAAYGPTIVEVDGTYDEVNRLCAEIAEEHPWAFVNVNLRPYYAEGGKTLGFEVAEQLGWRAPDHVVVPVASGSLLVKIHKGLQEFRRTGVIPAGGHTRVHGAQAAGCSPVALAFAEGRDEVRPVRPQTIARSLAIGAPADGRYVLRIARETGGRVVAVSDEEIVDAMRLLAATEGIFTETAGGVTIGVLRALAAEGVFGPDDVVVAYITGIGLKTLEAVEERLAPPIRIPPTLRDFERAVLDLVG